MKEITQSMKGFLAAVFMCALSAGNLVWAADGVTEHGGHARVRFIGNGLIGLTFYKNKSCVGGRGIQASRNGRNLGAALGILFGKAKNISLGIPETPNVTNLENWDVTLSKAFYREYSVNADEPLTIEAAYYFHTAGNHTSIARVTCNVDGFFVPEDGKDYEVTLNVGEKTCQLDVMKIDSAEAAVKLIPVKVKAANKCSAVDTGVPELTPEEQKAEDARIVPEGVAFKKKDAKVHADIDKHVDELLAKRRAERGFTLGASAQCPDCPQMIESPDGRQPLDGVHGLPQTDDAEINRWIKQIEPELRRYVTNQANYFNLPSNVVAIPCQGADDDLRKAAEFVDLSELPQEQQLAYERDHKTDGKLDYYFRDVRLWPVQASCVNGKLNGETDLWIFGNKVFDSATRLSVVPELTHVRFTAVNGKPVGLMNFVNRSEGPGINEYKDPVKNEEMKKKAQLRSEGVTFKYQQADKQENPRSVTVVNTIYDERGFKNSFEGPYTSVELPLSPGRTEVITFKGVRKAAHYLQKNGVLHGETIYYEKPKPSASTSSLLFPNAGKLFSKILPKETKEAITVTKKCFKDGASVDIDPCDVD
ncbi:hypothetical protein [Paraherbaspirillum soli]|uniref:Uncharacterized protein n=1 Tax=Paraherbaspirillum soli TaxID=631222 RepID=A0ABW0MEX5_9BURK